MSSVESLPIVESMWAWLTKCNVCGKPGTNFYYMGGNVYCCDEHGSKDNPRLKIEEPKDA